MYQEKGDSTNKFPGSPSLKMPTKHLYAWVNNENVQQGAFCDNKTKKNLNVLGQEQGSTTDIRKTKGKS